MMTRKEAEQRLIAVKKEIRYHEEESRRLEEEKYQLQKLIYQLKKKENTQNLLDSVISISKDNSMLVRLHHDTRTTPIMDSYYYSEKEFLVFSHIFHTRIDRKQEFAPVSLIVRKGALDVSAICDRLTMTDLKQYVGAVFASNRYSESGRIYSLIEEVLLAAPKVSKTNKVAAFEHPIRLGGQTYTNQTGYGSEYNGDDLVVQGTLYGETTSFYIIGIMID